MSKKVIKYIFELAFIFLIPLLFVAIGFKKEKVITLNENDVATKEEDYLSWEYPFNDYNNEYHYKNFLKLNQLAHEYSYTYYWVRYNVSYVELQDNKFFISNSTLITPAQYCGWDFKANHTYFYCLSYDINDYIGQARLIDYINGSATSTYVDSNKSLIYKFNTCLTDRTEDINFQIDIYTSGTLILNYMMLIDLTEMFGLGYEPSTITELNDYINTYEFINYTEDEEIIYYSENNNISDNWVINYTNLAKVYHGLIDGLHLSDIVVTRVVLFYTVMWLINFLIWHLVYRLFDKIFHIRKE